MALGGNLVTAQLASLVGLYGLTVIAILIFSAPAVLGEKSALHGARRRLPPPIAAAAPGFLPGFVHLARCVWRRHLRGRSRA